MDFLYRNIHMEQKKWDASTQITIEEDVNIPELKGDCLVMLLKEAVPIIEESRVGRDQVTVKGYLQYQVMYETGDEGRLEQLTGKLPFEEIIHVEQTIPGEIASAKAVIEDFKVSMINTRKIAVQSVVILYVHMHQLVEEDWTFDVANAGVELEKLFEEKEVMQLCQKKSDVFRVKEELEVPGGYPQIQRLLWNRITLGDLEVRPMEGKISLKGEWNGFFIYTAQGTGQSIKMFHKKVPFHGIMDCSACESDMVVSVIPTLNSYSVEVKPDMDGEDRILYFEAVLDLQIRIYGQEKVSLLQDMYSTTGEVFLQQKMVKAPVLHIAGEGKCKLKHSYKIKEASPKVIHLLHTCGSVLPDREVWENGKLYLTGSVHAQMLYQSNEAELPYAVCECDIPYALEMESNEAMDIQNRTEKPSIILEPRLEQLEAQMVDSEEMELKGILAISVLVMAENSFSCIGSAEIMPLDTAKYAALPGMVMCFADKETPLWDYGKQYYMSVEEIKRLNGLNDNVLKPGNGILLVKGTTG